MRADFANRHLQLPAQDEPGDDLQRIGVEVGAEQGLRRECAARGADEHPADGDGRQAGVVPDGGLREDLDAALRRAVPARHGQRRPGRSRVIPALFQRGEAAAHQPQAPLLSRDAGRSGREEAGIQAQTGDEGGHRAHGVQEVQGGVGAVADEHERAGRVPPVQPPNQLPRPGRHRLVPTVALVGVARGGGQGRQEGQRPDASRPRDGHEQRPADPAQAIDFDEVALAGADRVAVDAGRGDLGPRRRSIVSSIPMTSGPSPANVATSRPSRTRLASRLDHTARFSTRW